MPPIRINASNLIVRTRTRRKGSLVESAIRKTRQQELLKPNTPRSREGPRQGERRRWAALGRPDRP